MYTFTIQEHGTSHFKKKMPSPFLPQFVKACTFIYIGPTHFLLNLFLDILYFVFDFCSK